MNQLEKHKKAIKLLKAIEEANNRAESNKTWLATLKGLGAKFHEERLAINLAIKERLQNYYDKSFKL